MKLDESQLAFVRSDATNIRLLAPAGCGKTISLLHRCAHLAEHSTEQQRFLIVTFTKSAEQELKARLSQDPQFHSVEKHATITTLNAYGWRRIRDQVRNAQLIKSSWEKRRALMNHLRPTWLNHEYVEGALTGRGGNTARDLLDVMDSLKSMGFDHLRDTTRDDFERRIESLIEQGLGPRVEQQFEMLARLNVLEQPSRDEIESRPGYSVAELNQFYDRFFRFWVEATEELYQQRTFTYEDQKYWYYQDIRPDAPDGTVKAALSGAARYTQVFVDEFQDINPLDLGLIKAIIERNRAGITIVGDDDQAIFEWRGATPEYILNPEQHLGVACANYTLSINYRSPANIVQLSQNLITKNIRRVPKPVAAMSSGPLAEIEVVPTEGIGGRLAFVTDIARSVAPPGTIAVMGRNRSQLIPYEIYYASDGAPVKTATDLDVYASQGLDHLMSLLELWTQSDERCRSTQAINRVIDICDRIKRRPFNTRDRESLIRHLRQVRPNSCAEAAEGIRTYSGTALKGRSHTELHEAASEFCATDNVAEAIRCVREHFRGLSFDHEKSADDIWFTAPPLAQLADMAESEQLTADDLIERIEIAKERVRDLQAYEHDELDLQPGEERPLHLMTATRAKGKEFDTVVLLDTVKEFWPHSRTEHDPRAIEAERRLFYVAFTRARHKVFMLTEVNAEASPFIGELGLP